VALDALRNEVTDIPVIGVVLPGAKSAVVRTAQKKVGVIGTRATINSGAYTRAITHIDKDVKVYAKACPLFAPLVEEGFTRNDIARLTVQHYLFELVDTGIDCLILGCTHYPLLKEMIQGTVGSAIELIDSALWTAKETQDILTSLSECSPDKENGYARSTFYVTDLTPNYAVAAEEFLGRPLPDVHQLPLHELTSCAVSRQNAGTDV
jgi:glutamate racemase